MPKYDQYEYNPKLHNGIDIITAFKLARAPCPPECDHYEDCHNALPDRTIDPLQVFEYMYDFKLTDAFNYALYTPDHSDYWFRMAVDFFSMYDPTTMAAISMVPRLRFTAKYHDCGMFFDYLANLCPKAFMVNHGGYKQSLLCNHELNHYNMWENAGWTLHVIPCPYLYTPGAHCTCFPFKQMIHKADQVESNFFDVLLDVNQKSKEAKGIIIGGIGKASKVWFLDNISIIIPPICETPKIELTTGDEDIDPFDKEMIIEDVTAAINRTKYPAQWQAEAKLVYPQLIIDMIARRKFVRCKLYTAIEWKAPNCDFIHKMGEIYRSHITQAPIPKTECVETISGTKKDPHVKIRKNIVRGHKFEGLNKTTQSFVYSCHKIINRMHGIDKKKISQRTFNTLGDWVNKKNAFQDFQLPLEDYENIDFGDLHDAILLDQLPRTHKSIGNAYNIPIKDLQVDFRFKNHLRHHGNIQDQYDAALQYHYQKNPHHPEFWGEEQMSPEATIECLVDLLASAMRLTGNAQLAFDRIKQWLYTQENDLYYLRPKFENLNKKGMLWFYIWILRRGLSPATSKFIMSERNLPLDEQEKKIVWDTLTSDATPKSQIERLMRLPKFQGYLRETRQHISIVEYEMTQMRIACRHDRDKLQYQMIIPYVWKWWISQMAPSESIQTTTGSDDESDEECLISPSEQRNIFEKTWNKITAKYQELTSNPLDRIAKPIEEMKNAMLSAIHKMDGMINDAIKQVMKMMGEFFGYLNAKIPTLLSIIELIYAYVIWVNTDNLLLKISAFFAALHALDLYDAFFGAIGAIKDFACSYFETIEETTEHIETTTGDDTSIYSKIFDCLTDVCPAKAGFLCALLVVIFCGSLAIKNKKFNDLGTKCVESMKNIHFIGAGMLGIDRVFRYVCAVVKTSLEWIGDNIFGLGKVKEEEKKALEDYAKRVYTWGTKIEYYSTSIGIRNIKTSVKHCETAKALTVEGFEFMKGMPHTNHPRELDQYIRSKQRSLKEVTNLIYRVSTGGAFRHTPFHVQFYGKAGVGKSTLHRTLAAKIKDEYYPDTPLNRLMYSPMESTAQGDDWDSYDSTKKIIMVDEMFKVLTAESVTQWLNIISCAPLMVPMAHLEEKGEHFEAEWIISNTNVAYPRTSGIASHEAVWRRRHLLVEVVIDKDVFGTTSGKFELEKFAEKYCAKEYQTKQKMLKDGHWDRIKETRYEKELQSVLDTYPHLLFNLCNPLDTDNADSGDSGVKYLDPQALPNGIIEPTRNLSFQQLWEVITRRRSVLYDEEKRNINNGNIVDEMKKYDSEILDVIEAIDDQSPIVEQLTSHIAVPEAAITEELLYEVLEEDEDDSEIDNLFDQAVSSTSKVNETVEKPMRGLKIQGYLYNIDPDTCAVTLGGVPIVWSEEMRSMYNVAYDEELPKSIVGKFNSIITPTTGPLARDLIQRRSKLDKNLRQEIRVFGAESIKHIFKISNKLLPTSNFRLPKQASDPPLMCRIGEDTLFRGLQIKGGCEMFNDQYGSCGGESLDYPTIPASYDELFAHFTLTNGEKATHPNWTAEGMSIYYLSKIVEDKGKYYYKADYQDTLVVDYLIKKHKLVDWVPITVLNCIKTFNHTMTQFSMLSRTDKNFVLSSLTWRRKRMAELCAIRRISQISFHQAMNLIKHYLWSPIKYVWHTLAKMHSIIVKIGASVLTIALIVTIGRMFSGKSEEIETTSKAYVKQPKVIQARMQMTTQNDMLDSLVSKNLFEINCGSGPGNALGLRDHLFVMNAHALPIGYEHQDTFVLSLRRTRLSEDWWTIFVKTEDIFVMESQDLVFIKSKNISPFKDITKHFRTKEDNENFPVLDIMLEYVKNNKLHLQQFRVESIQRELSSSKSNGSPYVLRKVLMYTGTPVLGSSGGVLYTNNNYCTRNIVGIQCARFDRKGVATVLTREDIEIAADYLGTGVVHQGPHAQKDEIITPTTELITTHINITGTVPSDMIVGEIFKSDFQKTPIHEYIPESKRAPARLGKIGLDGKHPLTYSVNKCGRDVVEPLEPELLEYAVKEMAHDRIQRLGPGKFLRTLTFEQTLTGLAQDGCTSINTKTSPGIPYVYYRTASGKKSYVEFDEEGKIKFVSSKLRSDFEDADKLIRSGVLPKASMYEFPKDELRPSGKQTRSISVCPLVLNLLYRKYNLAYDAEMQSRADGTQEFCVGINPEGRAWTSMYACMEAMNTSGADLDVKNWDGHFPMDLKNAITKMRNIVYKKLGVAWNKEDDIARDTLAEFPIYGHTQFCDLVLQKNRGQSSGWAGTASENTDGHELLSDYLLMSLFKLETGVLCSKKFLQLNVCKRMYGDDIFYVIRESIKPYITIKKIAQMYRNYGWPVTSAASKDSEIHEVPLNEISFLKRTFKYYKYNTYLAALDKSVIYDMLYWQRRSADPNQFYVNVELALRYMFPYGKKDYEALAEEINIALEAKGMQTLPISYYREVCYYDYILFGTR